MTDKYEGFNEADCIGPLERDLQATIAKQHACIATADRLVETGEKLRKASEHYKNVTINLAGDIEYDDDDVDFASTALSIAEAGFDDALDAYQARSEKLQMPLSHRIFNELKHQASAPHEYVNPHFLREITSALEKYYNIEDQNVDSWIKDMFDA